MAATVTLPVKVLGRKINGIPVLGGIDAAGAPVWSLDGITWTVIETGGGTGMTDAERARLLPDPVTDGSLAVFRQKVAGVNYNDTDTILYMNAALGDTVNHANNNATPLPVTVSGFPAIVDGIWTIPNSGDVSIVFGANSYLTGTPEMTLDFYMEPTGFTSSSRTDGSLIQDNSSASTPIYLSNYGLGVAGKYDFWEYNAHSLSPNFSNNTLVHLAVDVYANTSGTRQYTVYRDGTPIRTRETGATRFADVVKLFGQDGSGNVLTNLKLHYVRISKVARYKGVAFTPPGATGYVNAPAGAWSGENIDTVAAGRLLPGTPAIGSMAVFEGVTTGDGRNNAKTKLLLPLTSDFSDTAVGSVSAAVTSAGAVAIAPGTGKFGGGAARFTGDAADQIKVAYPTALLTAQTCKISFWFRLANGIPADNRYIFISKDAFTRYDSMILLSFLDGKVLIFSGMSYAYPSNVYPTLWNFVEFIYQDGNWYAYLNGKQACYEVGSLAASDYLCFGRTVYEGANRLVFDGWLSDILIEQGGDYSAEIGATHAIPDAPATPFVTTGQWVPKTPAEVKALMPPDPWTTLTYAAAVTVQASSPQQKLTLTGDCVITPPTLTAGKKVVLKVKGTGQSLTVGSGTAAALTGSKLYTWMHDGDGVFCVEQSIS